MVSLRQLQVSSWKPILLLILTIGIITPTSSFSQIQQVAKPGSLQMSSPSLTTSNRVQQTLDPCVILMKKIIAKHQHLWPGEGIYSLAQGVVYWSPPSSAYAAISDAVSTSSSDLHQYCPDEGLDDLVEALTLKLEKENNLPLSTTKVIVTSGANQAYMNCVLSLLSENDLCVVFKPYYFNHVMAVQMTRGDEALSVGPVDEDGIPSLEWLKDQLQKQQDGDEKKIKMVTLTNPGNPTGVSIPKNKLEEIVNLCKEYGIWLVMDNTYEQFDHPRVNLHSMTDTNGDDDELTGFHCFADEHVINIFSFSKGYAMAGFRVGYVAVNTIGDEGKDMYEQMLKVQDTIPICTSRISQIAALGALSAGRKWVAEKVCTLDTGREAILEALAPLETTIGGTGAMYVMGKLPGGKDDMEVANLLVEKYGVAIIPGSFCGYPGWIRVCYSNLPPEKCAVAAARLSKGIHAIC